MALNIYDENQVALTSLHSYIDGSSGGTHEFKIFLRNDDVTKYYTGIILKYTIDGVEYWYEPDVSRVNVRISTPAIGFSGGPQPTATEWKFMPPSDNRVIEDIGSALLANTSYIPLWVRVFVPGGTTAQTLDHGLTLSFVENSL